MEKTIKVCDFCGAQDPAHGARGFEMCGRCAEIWHKIHPIAVEDVQESVKFSVDRRLTLLSLLRENADPKYWGSEGLKLREEMIKAYEQE